MRSDLQAEPAVVKDDAILLRALLDHGALAIAVVDSAGRLAMMSPGLQAMVGTSGHGLPATDFPELFCLYDAEGTALLRPGEVPVTRAANGETVRDVIISVRRPGQPVRYLRCNAFPLERPGHRRAGAIVLVADITTEHTAVTRQDSIRSLLLDTVNHELRTPLTAVLGNAELISDTAAELPAELHGPLSAIVRASERLRDTMAHISDLVDLEAATEPVRSDRPVHKVLLPVVERHRHRAEQRHIQINIECPETMRWKLDPTLTRKALGALVDNAVTHGPSHSSVTITASVSDDLLHLRVTDRGPGIPHQDQERLTQPFERGDRPTSGPHRRGLGLPLAQAVAASHHGALLLKNHPPRGFTASLILT